MPAKSQGCGCRGCLEQDRGSRPRHSRSPVPATTAPRVAGEGRCIRSKPCRTRRSRKSADLHGPNPRNPLLRTQPPLRTSRTTKSASFSASGRIRGRWSKRRQRRSGFGDNTDGTSPERYPSVTPARLSAHSGRPVRPERRSGCGKPCRRSPSPPCTDGTKLWRRAV